MNDCVVIEGPKPGTKCLQANGCKVRLPNGDLLPNVGNVTIEMPATGFCVATIECLARIEKIDALANVKIVKMVEYRKPKGGLLRRLIARFRRR